MRQELLVPRGVFEGALAALIADINRHGGTAAAEPGSLPVACGRAVLLESQTRVAWSVLDLRIPRLQSGNDLPSPAQPMHPESAVVGLVSVWWLPDVAGGGMPTAKHDWLQWLESAARNHRMLALRTAVPLMLVLVTRHGHASGVVLIDRTLLPLARICLPGAAMRRIELLPPPACRPEPRAPEESARYSRLAGALGPSVLRRIQSSVFGIVGLGRTGSRVATTLARYGASLLLIDDDIVEQHNANDGDALVPSFHEGQGKATALARALSPLARPGASILPRRLPVASRITGHLLGDVDMLISAVDNDAARFCAASWAAALVLPHLDVGVSVPLVGEIGADVRLTLPGAGCLACVGGYADGAELAGQLGGARAPAADFRTQRRGSLRSIGGIAVDLGVRLIEQLYEGRLAANRFLQLQEDSETGAIRLTDRTLQAFRTCPVCAPLAGIGARGINRQAANRLASRIEEAARRIT
jgi:hypothetical protein